MGIFCLLQDIIITPSQVGLPLCKICRRPIRTDLHRHEGRCWWCETCEDFIAADVSRHVCVVPGPNHFPCPICGAMQDNSNYMRHIKVVHKDVDAQIYRRKSETAKHRAQRLEKEGEVCHYFSSFECR